MSTPFENPHQRLEQIVAEYSQLDEKLMGHPNYTFKNALSSFWYDNERRALHSWFNLHDMEATKQYFYTCGKLDVLRVSRFNEPLFGYGRTHVSYVALSDNKTFIDEFSQLNYIINYEERGKKKQTSFIELSAKGSQEIYCHAMINAMKMDEEGLAKNIQIYEQITSQLKKHKAMEIDFDFFRGILKKDKDAVFKAIETLTTPKIHKARNLHSPLYNQLISEPAMGFAKIAWINGMEIEPTSKLIAKELLPVKPNLLYNDDYLKYDK